MPIQYGVTFLGGELNLRSLNSRLKRLWSPFHITTINVLEEKYFQVWFKLIVDARGSTTITMDNRSIFAPGGFLDGVPEKTEYCYDSFFVLGSVAWVSEKIS